jgi:hypothetical protein
VSKIPKNPPQNKRNPHLPLQKSLTIEENTTGTVFLIFRRDSSEDYRRRPRAKKYRRDKRDRRDRRREDSYEQGEIKSPRNGRNRSDSSSFGRHKSKVYIEKYSYESVSKDRVQKVTNTYSPTIPSMANLTI